MTNRFALHFAALFALFVAGCGGAPDDAAREQVPLEQDRPEPTAYHVWAADQNLNSVYVLDRDGGVVRVIDADELGGADRPHMLWGVPGDPYVYSANTVSGSVTVLDRETGQVLAVVESVGKSPHAAQPSPTEPERVFIFNIGPQAADEEGQADLGETLAEMRRSGGAEGEAWEIQRFLDLKAEPALADSERFPSRRPVCGGFSKDGRSLLVTLFDGGLAVVDLDEWKVSKSWGNDLIARHGCGFAPSPDGNELYVTAGDMQSSWLYVFDVSGPEPDLRVSHDLSAAGQDAHGVYVDPEREELWVVHRVSDNVTIHPLTTIREPGHDFEMIEFVGKAPDLVAFSPDAQRAYISLRGPKPAPTIPHATVGETPGIAILDVPQRKLLNIVELGDPVESDFHGLFIPEAGSRGRTNATY